tara:strand:+ start:394 stop:612 length:219 start_codon:yes stop_codon:yes gene_type:complete
MVLKKLLFIFTFNISLFLLLIVGIQNSASRKKINLVAKETVNLPISFIMGVNFITGSLVGSILILNNTKKKE